jgi:hypothetical protein
MSLWVKRTKGEVKWTGVGATHPPAPSLLRIEGVTALDSLSAAILKR